LSEIEVALEEEDIEFEWNPVIFVRKEQTGIADLGGLLNGLRYWPAGSTHGRRSSIGGDGP
jgi:hypothetical protein